jgi:hypothetical protein
MNEFKQEILAAIESHPMVTSLDLMDEMMLDESVKPKLARSLSELKKDGYLDSVKGESGLLEWSVVDGSGALDTVCPKPEMKFSIRKVEDEKVDEPVKVEAEKEQEDYVPEYAVIGFKHSADDEVFGTFEECLDDARIWVGDGIESVNIYQVMVKPIAKYDFIPARTELNWLD